MDLISFLKWVISGGGAGLVAYLLMGKVKWFWDLDGEAKRWVAAGLSALIATGAWALLSAGTKSFPTGDWWEWAQAIFLVAASSFEFATLIHARELKGTVRVARD